MPTSHIALAQGTRSPTGSSVAFTYTKLGPEGSVLKEGLKVLQILYNGEWKHRGDFKIKYYIPPYPNGYIGHFHYYSEMIERLKRIYTNGVTPIRISPNILKIAVHKLYKLRGDAYLYMDYYYQSGIDKIYRVGYNENSDIIYPYSYSPVGNILNRVVGTGEIVSTNDYSYGDVIVHTTALRGSGSIDNVYDYQVLITDLTSVRGEGRINWDVYYSPQFESIYHTTDGEGYIYVNDQLDYSPVILPTTFVSGEGDFDNIQYSYSDVLDPVNRYFSTEPSELKCNYSYSPETTSVNWVDAGETTIRSEYSYSDVLDKFIVIRKGEGDIDLGISYSEEPLGKLRFANGRGKLNMSPTYDYSEAFGSVDFLVGTGDIQLTTTIDYTPAFGHVEFIVSPGSVDISNEFDYRPEPLGPINYAEATETTADFPRLAIINSNPFRIFRKSKKIEHYTETYTEIVPFIERINTVYAVEHYSTSGDIPVVESNFLSKGQEIYDVEYYAIDGTEGNIEVIQSNFLSKGLEVYDVEHYTTLGDQSRVELQIPVIDNTTGLEIFALEHYTLEGYTENRTETLPRLHLENAIIFDKEHYVLEGEVSRVSTEIVLPNAISYPEDHHVYDLELYITGKTETLFEFEPMVNDLNFDVYDVELYTVQGDETTVERTVNKPVIGLPSNTEIYPLELYTAEGNETRTAMPSYTFIEIPEDYVMFEPEMYINRGVRNSIELPGLVQFTNNFILNPEKYVLEGQGTTDLPTMIRIRENVIYPESIKLNAIYPTTFNTTMLSLINEVYPLSKQITDGGGLHECGTMVSITNNLILDKAEHIPELVGQVYDRPTMSNVTINTILKSELYVVEGDETDLVVANDFINSSNFAIYA